MPRFYCQPPLPTSGRFILPAAAAHHASRVLRLRVGDAIQLFDGLGNERHGVIAEIANRQVIVGEILVADSSRESPLRVLLAQALPSAEKMDWIIQKATELGVAEIQAINASYSVARLPADRVAKRVEHWQQVAVSACEQCGRNVLPRIDSPMDMMAWLEQAGPSSDTKLMMDPRGTVTLTSQARPQGRVTLLIGAEGGFTRAESDAATHSGFRAIRMGARVLRTETAALAALSALQTLWGDFQ
jgi:16S rRNA (uracil1498-N3)-methyltransferase